MINMLKEATQYLQQIEEVIKTKEKKGRRQQLARKNAFVALANLSDAFNRMLSEPKSRQKDIERIHQFVVLSNMLISYMVSLSGYLLNKNNEELPEEFKKAVEEINQYFHSSINVLNSEFGEVAVTPAKESIRKLNKLTSELLEKRKSN
jgi:uncharacterized membrane protein YccC